MEPQFNEPLYNKVLDLANDFLIPIIVTKINEKERQYNETSLTNKFYQSLGPLLNRGSPVLGMEKVSCMRESAKPMRTVNSLYFQAY